MSRGQIRQWRADRLIRQQRFRSVCRRGKENPRKKQTQKSRFTESRGQIQSYLFLVKLGRGVTPRSTGLLSYTIISWGGGCWPDLRTSQHPLYYLPVAPGFIAVLHSRSTTCTFKGFPSPGNGWGLQEAGLVRSI